MKPKYPYQLKIPMEHMEFIWVTDYYDILHQKVKALLEKKILVILSRKK